jgi:uncharacterized protein YozE (UPF0346 family)
MSDTITEYLLNQECESLAKSIIEEYEGDRDDMDALREYAQERAHEDADGHQWVIYTYKARQVAAIAPDAAEEWLEEIYSKPFDSCDTYNDVCTCLAYAAMYTGIMSALDTIFEELEAA